VISANDTGETVALAELGQALGKVRHGGVDGGADQEFCTRGAGGAADDVDDMAVGFLEQRPQQPSHPHATEEFRGALWAPLGPYDVRGLWHKGRPAGLRDRTLFVAPPNFVTDLSGDHSVANVKVVQQSHFHLGADRERTILETIS